MNRIINLVSKIRLSNILTRTSDFKLLLFSFLIFILIYRLYYFDCFYVPDADFFDFNQKAISFINFESPKNYEHLPLYSALMGLLSMVLPGKDSILFAAELINLVGSLVALLLLYLISSKFLRKSAFLIVMLFALHPLTAHMTIQPRAEMLTLMLILLGIYLNSINDNKRISYLCAFFASITRYEGAILILSLFIKDLIFSKTKISITFIGFLSSLGTIAWLLLNYTATGHLNPYYDHLGGELSSSTVRNIKLNAAGIQYIKLILHVLFLNFIPTGSLSIKEILAVIALLLSAIGFYSFSQKSFKNTLLLFLFLIGHFLIHLIYFTQAEQHVFLISWILYLAIIGGLERFLEFMDKGFYNSLTICTKKANMYEAETKVIFYILVLVLTTVTLLLTGLGSSDKYSYGYWIVCIISSAFIFWFINIAIDSIRELNRLLIILLLPILGSIVGKDILLTQKTIESAIYTKAELRLVGEWYSQNAKNGEKIVVTEPRIAGYYADQLSYHRGSYISNTLPVSGRYSDKHGNFIFLGSFDASSYESFIIELQKKGIIYVVWNSHHGKYPQNSYYYKKDKIFLISKLNDGRDGLNFKLTKTIKVGPNYAFIYKFVP